MSSDGYIRIRSGSITSLAPIDHSKELKKADMLCKEFGGKKRTIEGTAGTKFISDDGLVNYSNFCKNENNSTLSCKPEDIKKFHTKLKKSIGILKDLSGSLVTSKTSRESGSSAGEITLNTDFKSKVQTVKAKLKELHDLADRLHINDKDLLNISEENCDDEMMLKAVNKALIGAASLKVLTKSKPGLFERAVNMVKRHIFNRTTPPAASKNEGFKCKFIRHNKNDKLFKDIPYDVLKDHLFDAVEHGDVEFVRNVLEHHSGDAKKDAKVLFRKAMHNDGEEGHIIQLLVNKDLFTTEGLTDELKEAIEDAEEGSRKAELLTGISKPGNDKLRANVPLTTLAKTPENLNIEQLVGYIKKNDTDKISAMIKLGQIDLRDLTNEQLFDILDATANKIKRDTMELLLENGFNLRNATTEANQNYRNVFDLIDRFRNDVLSLLGKNDIIKSLLATESYGFGKHVLGVFVSQNNLKAVKILFEKFNATHYFDYYRNLAAAIKKNNPAMVKYFLKKTKKLSGPDDPKHAQRKELIELSSFFADDHYSAEEDKKNSVEIASLIRKKFKDSTIDEDAIQR